MPGPAAHDSSFIKIIRQVRVPSLAAFLLQVSAIIIAYGVPSGSKGEITAGIIIGCAGVGALPFIFRYSVAVCGGAGYKNILRCLLFSLIILLPALGSVTKIISFTAHSTPPYPSPCIAEITSITQGRYTHTLDLLLRNSGNNERGTVMARAYCADDIGARRGDLIEIKGRPVMTTKTRPLSRFEKSMARRGIRVMFFIDRFSVKKITAVKPDIFGSARDAIMKKIDRIFSHNTAGLIRGLYFANQNFIDKKLVRDYKNAGVSHILSASGLHVGVIAALPLLLFGLFRFSKKTAWAVTVPLIMGYLFLTDMPSCLVRSCVMIGMFTLMNIAHMGKNSWNALFLSGNIVLALFPYELYEPGFQLSFGATAGILALYRKYREGFAALPSFAAGSLAITCAAQAAAAPIIMLHMNEFNITGFISNLVIVPLSSLVLVASIPSVALSFFSGPIGGFLALITDLLCRVMNSLVAVFAACGGNFHPASAAPPLVCLFTLSVIPLIRWNIMKKISPLLFIGALAGTYLFLQLMEDTPRPVTIFRHAKGVAVVSMKRGSITVAGNLPDRPAFDSFISLVNRGRSGSCTVYITNADCRNIKLFSSFIKNFSIQRCYITSGVKLGQCVMPLMRILSIDGVPVRLINFNAALRGGAGEALLTDDMDAVWIYQTLKRTI